MSRDDYDLANPNRIPTLEETQQYVATARAALGPRQKTSKGKPSLRQSLTWSDLYGPVLGPPSPTEETE